MSNISGKTQYKKQHYVPKFYLREFSSDGERVYCYDKIEDKSYPTNVKNICAENGFYNLIDEDDKDIEKGLALLDGFCSRTHKKILKNNFEVLNLEEMSLYLMFLVFLLSRGIYRRSLVEKEANEWAEKMNAKFVKEGITDWHVKPDLRIHHLRSMILSGNEDRKLFENNWLVLKNRTDLPFQTSDNPMIKIENNGSSKYYFVLSPSKVMISQKPFDNYLHFRYGFLNEEKEIKKINKIVYDNAYRVIISDVKDHLDY